MGYWPRRVRGEMLEQAMNRGDIDPGLTVAGVALVVAGQAPTMREPRQRPLHNPALRERYKASLVGRARDHRDLDPIVFLDLDLECASIVAVAPELDQLGIPRPIHRQQQRRPIPI